MRRIAPARGAINGRNIGMLVLPTGFVPVWRAVRRFRTYDYDPHPKNQHYYRENRIDLRMYGISMSTYTRLFSSRITQKRYIFLFALVVLYTAHLWFFGKKVPYINRKQSVFIPYEMDNDVGEWAFELINGKVLPKYHPYSVEVTAIANKLLRAMERDQDREPLLEECLQWEWKICVVENDEINAYCLPGGKVVVHSGLLKAASDSTQLAFVIAHEIGHALARHGIEKRISFTLLSIASYLYGQDLWSTLFVELPSSRRKELEADIIGLHLTCAAGYTVSCDSIEDFFSMLPSADSSDGGQTYWWSNILSTHPSHKERIRKLINHLPECAELKAQRKTEQGAEPGFLVSMTPRWTILSKPSSNAPHATYTYPPNCEVVDHQPWSHRVGVSLCTLMLLLTISTRSDFF
ncbi:Mitochondrial metalloendopeptidase OMA1 [Diplonema papillatum]|nr:Mitochondrial metalloendopeptidase OMA1 [Diplonema papillatum]|eukprot:gene17592-27081_t